MLGKGKGFDSMWNGSRCLVGVLVTVGVTVGLGSSSGGSGKTAYSLEGPTNLSGSASSCDVERALRELLRDGSARLAGDTGPKVSDSGDRGEVEPGILVVGLVPARFLGEKSCEIAGVVTMKGGLV